MYDQSGDIKVTNKKPQLGVLKEKQRKKSFRVI